MDEYYVTLSGGKLELRNYDTTKAEVILSPEELAEAFNNHAGTNKVVFSHIDNQGFINMKANN